MSQSFQFWRASDIGAFVNRLILSVLPCFGQLNGQATPAHVDQNVEDRLSETLFSDLPPIQTAYLPCRTVAPLLYRFKRYNHAVWGPCGLQSLAFVVDYGHGYGEGLMQLPPKIPAGSVPSEEGELLRKHLNRAMSVMRIEERAHLKHKYGFEGFSVDFGLDYGIVSGQQ